MKKKIKDFSIGYIIGVIGLSPIIMLGMYITYTEKIGVPILISTLLLASIVVVKIESEE